MRKSLNMHFAITYKKNPKIQIWLVIGLTDLVKLSIICLTETESDRKDEPWKTRKENVFEILIA